ncbi:MAG: Trehalase, partial [Microbacteriaceae bacterium]|nr:Trehalase [Microbacteriaceae bacterium]
SLALDVATSAMLNNFPEYIDPHSRAPRGTLRFSWTAALSLDLINRMGASR